MTLSINALPAPAGQTCIITTALMQKAIAASRCSPRKRIILPFHKSPQDPLHRMLNAVQPGSYIRPHRHLLPPKPESILVLQGAVACFVFNPEGAVLEVQTLMAGGAEFGFDSEAGIYHTFLALCPDTVLFEVKPGPYSPDTDKDFAPWAPLENSDETTNYLHTLLLLSKKAEEFSPSCRGPQI